MLAVINNAKIMVDTSDNSLHIKVGDRCIPVGTGGSGIVETVVLELHNAEFSELDGSNPDVLYCDINNDDDKYMQLQKGKKYIVEWKGNKYTFDAKTYVYGDEEYLYLGNISLWADWKENTGEPILVLSTQYDLQVFVESAEFYHDVKITMIEDKSAGGSGGGNVVGFYVDPLGEWHCTETYADAKKLIFENCAAVTFVHMRDGIYYSDVYVQLYSVGTEYEYMTITYYKGSSSKGSRNFKMDGTFVAVPA